MAEQIPFGTDDFAENPEPRCPCVLVLDTSGSMQGAPIQLLNEGVRFYRDEVAGDSLASKRVEVAIVSFGPVEVRQDFTTAAQFQPPELVAEGSTPMGAAIVRAIQMVQDRKQVYRTNGVGFFRPWIFLISDGAPDPHDPWQEAARQIKEGEAAKAFTFWSVGVEGADFSVLKQLSARGEPLRLKGLQFREFFAWLSNSQQAVSRSAPGAAVPLENPTAPNGWAIADV